MKLLLAQLYDELYKLYARKRTYIGFGAFVLLQLIIAGMFSRPEVAQIVEAMLDRNGLDIDEYFGGLTFALLINFFSINPLGAVYVALIAGDIVAKEHEEGTLRLVLARPVSRTRVVLIKYAACLVYTVSLVLFLAATSLLTGLLMRGSIGGLAFLNPTQEVFYFIPPDRAPTAYAMATLGMGFAVALLGSVAFMFSCFKMKASAAIVLAMSFFFIDFILYNMPFFRPYREYFFHYHVSFYLRLLGDHPSYVEAWMSLIHLTAANITCVAVGVVRFATRDLKG